MTPAETRAGGQPLALIIDDEPFFQMVLGRLLEQAGVSSLVALDAAEARSMLKTETFDVILIDLRLPGEDGPVLVEEIEENRALASRSIVVTAYPTVARIFTTSLPVVEKGDVKEIRNQVSRLLAARTTSSP
jgi:CheY-like chemotaxis protein